VRALAPLAAGLLAGCLQLSISRDSRDAPVPAAALAELQPGTSDLGACLALLGAPLWVQEHEVAGGSGALLAYGWRDERDLGLRFSVPVSRGVSASLDYDRSDRRTRGLVLFFDPDWRLTAFRTGLLLDLTRERRPPAAPEEEGA
jgi:hypothetical protein